jgi:hypothetical protein
VINPRSMVILIRDHETNQFEDKTRDVSEIRTLDQRIEIVFINNSKPFRYGRDRVRILRDPKRHPLAEGEWVEANGSVWENATEVLTFTGTSDAWRRIFYRTQAAGKYSTYPASRVRVITSATPPSTIFATKSIIQNCALKRVSGAECNILKKSHDTPHAVIKKQRLS